MKAFIRRLKKFNRGLILGLVLVIGLVIYITVENQIFKSEVPEIEALFNGYMSEMEKYAVIPEKYIGYEGDIPTEELDALKNDYVEFLNRYWTPKKEDNVRYCNNLDMIMDNYNFISNYPYEYITEYSSMATGVEIKKNGPEGARIDCNIRIDVTGTPKAEILTASWNEQVEWYSNDMSVYSEDYESQPKTLSQYTISGEYTFYLEKTDGEWKITYTDGYLYTGHWVSDVETEEDNEEDDGALDGSEEDVKPEEDSEALAGADTENNEEGAEI